MGESADRLVATPAAVEALERLTAEHGRLVLFLSGGCCDGSSPMCLADGDLLLGPADLRLGEVAGVPFYVDSDQYERWNRPAFELDVAPGEAGGFSLEALHGVHFVARTPMAPRPSCAA